MTELVQRSILLRSEYWPVILCFFERFGETLGLTAKFQSIEDVVLADESNETVVSFFHKLLQSFGQRLLRKYYKYLWEKALLVFAETYGIQCVEVLRSGGYLSLPILDRLPLIKELCEAQFDVCAQLKDKVNSDISAEELRLKPLIQDKDGDSYWLFTDSDGKFVLYKEMTSTAPSGGATQMKVIACTLNELDEFLHSLRAQGVQPQRSHGMMKTSEITSEEEQAISRDDHLEGYDTYCEICHIDRNPEKLLLCDSCDCGYHTDCLCPPLGSVPQGDWHCSSCLEGRLYTVIEERQKDITHLVRKAARYRKQEAKCLKLEQEAAFFAGLSTGQRSRNVHQLSYKVDFYSDKAFDLAIQEAIYQNETKSLPRPHRSMDGAQPPHHIDHAVVAVCNPMRRQTRAVSRLAAVQVHLAHDRRGELSGSESSSDGTELLSDTVSSDGKDRDSAYSYHSSEAKSEETATMSDSSCKAVSDGERELYNRRKSHGYCPITCVNGAHRKLRASSRTAAHRLSQLIEEESEFEIGDDGSDKSDKEEVCLTISSDSDVKSDTWSHKHQVRLMICEDSTSDDSCAGKGSLAALKKQHVDSEFGNSSSFEEEDKSDTTTWRSRKPVAVKKRNSRRLLQGRKQHIHHHNQSSPLHLVQKDHCYAQIKACRYFSQETSDVEQASDCKETILKARPMHSPKKRPTISEERETGALPIMSTGDAVNLITSQKGCAIFPEDRMVEDDIDSFSSDVELTKVTCCHYEDSTIDILSSD